MKLITISILLIANTFVYSQQSEDLIPTNAISVFSINSSNLLQKISLNDLVKYDFMEDIHQELFDGSTSGKTLKESGIDFDEKFNVFFGKGQRYEVSGFTFGVANEDQLFVVFDDFEQQKSDYDGTELYNSYFNHLVISESTGIMIRVTANYKFIQELTDSLWMARGNDYPWYNNAYYESVEETVEAARTVEFTEDMETAENTVTPTENPTLPEADEDPTQNNYFELRDSLEMVYNDAFLKEVLDDLFIKKNNLKKSSALFSNQLTHESEGTFYFDNSRYNRLGRYNYYRPFYSSLYRYIDELYEKNTIVGDIVLNDGSINLEVDANYNEKLGSIYTKMSSAKFDKNVLKYIHKDNRTFFTYNINLREAYEQAYKIVTPLLEESENERALETLISLEIFDEFANKDALFDTYRGSMFGCYSGIQKVKTKKIVFDYDDETFEYTEREEEAEEDMPIFTIGFSSKNAAFSEKILKRIETISRKEIYKKGNVWIIEKGMMDAAPLYIIVKNELFIFTNNEDLAINHSDGYGADALSKTLSKKAKNSPFLFGYADLGKAIEELPSGLFNSKENELVELLKGRSGQVEITSSDISSEKASFNLDYTFDGENEDAAIYILDLINSLYVNLK